METLLNRLLREYRLRANITRKGFSMAALEYDCSECGWLWHSNTFGDKCPNCKSMNVYVVSVEGSNDPDTDSEDDRKDDS